MSERIERPWVDLAEILLNDPGATVNRALLRRAMPELGQQRGGGRKSARKLQKVLVEWERLGLIRRCPDDTIAVLDRSALRQHVAVAESHFDMRLIKREVVG